jgi:hypothetical protein
VIHKFLLPKIQPWSLPQVFSIGQKNELQFFDADSDVPDVGFDCVDNLVDMAGEDQFSPAAR